LCVIQRPTRVAEPLGDDLRVLAERVDGLARHPAALVLERLWEIPVVERHERLDVVREQLVHDPVVEVEAGLVHPTASLGQDPRPRDRETERVQPELTQERDVLAIAVVEVAGDEPGVARSHLARRCREAIPDALAAAVLGRRAFDLVRGRRGAPHELCGEDGGEIVGHRVPSGQVMDSRT